MHNRDDFVLQIIEECPLLSHPLSQLLVSRDLEIMLNYFIHQAVPVLHHNVLHFGHKAYGP